MVKWLHIVSQILAMAGQIYVPQLPLEDVTKHVVQTTLGFVQGVLGIIALAVDPNSGKGKLAGAAGLGAVLVLLCGAVSQSTRSMAPPPRLHVASRASWSMSGVADRPRPFFRFLEAIA